MDNKIDLKLYRSFFEQSPDGMFVTDFEGNFILANSCFCDLIGYSNDELQQLNVLDTYLESERDLFTMRCNLLKERKKILFERSLKRKNGAVTYVQIHLKTLDNRWIQGIIRDIPVKKSILTKLEENEERFQQLTEHIRDVFFLLDLTSANWLYVSPGYEKIWQKSVNEVLRNSTSWMKQVYPEDRDRVNMLYQHMLKTGLFKADFRIIRPDGSIRWIYARAYPVYNKEKQLYRSVGIAEDITDHMNLEKERIEHSEKIRFGFKEMIIALSTALEQRDAYTAGHQSNVAYLSVVLAKELNLSENQVELLEIAAQVHDIGKIGIPIEILTKPGKLSNLEFELIKTHAQAGYDILKGVHFPWPVAKIVLEHHERLDGSGYPKGLKGDEICIESRVLAVADTVDAMVSYRPYRPALGVNTAITELHKFSGSLFDPEVVNACEKLFREKKFTIYSKN